MTGKIHEGKNVKRIREILGIKQEVLGEALGFNQQKISLLEQKEVIETEILEQIANIFKAPIDIIRRFNEDIFNAIAKNAKVNGSSSTIHLECNFNPINKIIELYDALLRSEREKVEILKAQMNNTPFDSSAN